MFETVKYLAGAYFHEDYLATYGNAEGAIRAFEPRPASEMPAKLITEIEQLLSSGRSEAELHDLWVTEWDSNYEPTDDGMTYQQWFRRVREILSER